MQRGRVQTRCLQAVREGLEDVAYMDRLEKELARFPKGRYPAYEKLISSRKGIMKRADQAEVDKWRMSIGRAIDAMVTER